MKKFIFILWALTFLQISCSEDAFAPLAEDFYLFQLVGTWSATELVVTGCEEERQNGSITCDSEACLILIIDPDGSFTIVDNFDNSSSGDQGNLFVDESTITLCPSSNTDCEDNQYILSEETLTLSYEDAETGCSFVLLLNRQ